MKVKDFMTKNPSCVTPDMQLNKAAKIMADENIGSVPVVEKIGSKKIVGVITDRDIATRAVAKSMNPLQMTVKDIMSTPVVTVKQDDDVKDVAKTMQKHMIRRVPVVDENGDVCGMVAQADIALKTTDQTTADVVQSVSKPTERSSKI